jgi:hypothetical protein
MKGGEGGGGRKKEGRKIYFKFVASPKTNTSFIFLKV